MAVGQTHDDCVQCHGLQTKRSRFCHTSHACHMMMHAGTLQVDYHSSNPQLLVCAHICQRLLAEVPFISALCTCSIELHQPDGLHEGLLAGGDTRSQRWQGQAGQAAGSLQESCKGIRLQALQAVAPHRQPHFAHQRCCKLLVAASEEAHRLPHSGLRQLLPENRCNRQPGGISIALASLAPKLTLHELRSSSCSFDSKPGCCVTSSRSRWLLSTAAARSKDRLCKSGKLRGRDLLGVLMNLRSARSPCTWLSTDSLNFLLTLRHTRACSFVDAAAAKAKMQQCRSRGTSRVRC